MEAIFSNSSWLVMPFWMLMVFLPHWSVTKRIIGSLWVVVPATLLYAGLVLPDAVAIFGEVSSPTLEGITALLGTPAGATISWVHFLAFDLFIGRWIYLDSREQEISALLVSPLLIFVLMLGPLGLLGYLTVRTVVVLRHKQTAAGRRVTA